MPSFKIEKVSLKKAEARNQQRCERNGAFGTASCPDLSQPRSLKESATKENKLHTPKNVAQHNVQQILPHRFWPHTLSSTSTAYNSATINGLIDDTASLRVFDIFGAFACPQIPPGGLPCNSPCKCSKCPDGCYQVTFDTPHPCNGPVCPGTHSGMAPPNPNCFPTCPSCGGYCQNGRCGCTSYRGWGPCGPCSLCCCCAAPNSNSNAAQVFYAPCSPEALRNPSQACIGTVLCSNAAPVDCCNSGSTPANSACFHGCGCSGCHHGWDSYHSGSYQPSSHYGQCHCHCCCAAQLAALPNYEPDSTYFNNYDASGWCGCNSCAQHQYDPSWCNYGCGYQNSWASPYQYSTPYQYNYASYAATSEDLKVPCIEEPVCEAELAECPVEAASPRESSKQPPEPPKCIKNIWSPASDAAAACFCPDCTKKPTSVDKASIVSNPNETGQKPLPPPRWHGINPTLAKTYPFNSTTRKYHQRTTPVNMARASFSCITPQAIKASNSEHETKENSDEVEMPQVWSFPESYKRFFERLSTAKTINLKSLNGNKPS